MREHHSESTPLISLAQDFTVVLDTGSSNLWLIDISCTDQSCLGYPESGFKKRRFDKRYLFNGDSPQAQLLLASRRRMSTTGSTSKSNMAVAVAKGTWVSTQRPSEVWLSFDSSKLTFRADRLKADIRSGDLHRGRLWLSTDGRNPWPGMAGHFPGQRPATHAADSQSA